MDIIRNELKYGNKPEAKYYNTYPYTIIRWVKKYNEKEGLFKFK